MRFLSNMTCSYCLKDIDSETHKHICLEPFKKAAPLLKDCIIMLSDKDRQAVHELLKHEYTEPGSCLARLIEALEDYERTGLQSVEPVTSESEGVDFSC